jgi:hypothetical protein
VNLGKYPQSLDLSLENRYFSGQGTSLSMSVQEEQEDKVVVQAARSVHRKIHEYDRISGRSVYLSVYSPAMQYVRPDRVL